MSLSKSNSIQSATIIPSRVISCSCCHEQGHNIKTCRSPEIFRFQIEAKLSAKNARCIADLQQVAPFNNARPVLLKAISIRLRQEKTVSNIQSECLIKNLASYYWKRYNPAGSNYATSNEYCEARISSHILTEMKMKEEKKRKTPAPTEQEILRQLAPQLIRKIGKKQVVSFV